MQSLWGKVDKFNIKICHFTALKCSLEKINYLVTMATTAYKKFPNGVLTAHTEWLPGVRLRHSTTTCAVHTDGM